MSSNNVTSQEKDSVILNLMETLEENEKDFIQFHLSSETLKISYYYFCKYTNLIQEEYQNEIVIKNIIDKLEQDVKKHKIKEDNIKIFFKVLQEENVQITGDNFLDLYKLSILFKVNSLRKFLTNYSKKFSHNLNFIINLLYDQISSENIFFTVDDIFSVNIEEFLADNINECLQIDTFGKLPTSTIYRILQKSDREKLSSDLLYDFINKSIIQRNSFFSFLDLKKLSIEKFNSLHSDYVENEGRYFDYLKCHVPYIKELLDTKNKRESEALFLAYQNQFEFENKIKDMKTKNSQLADINKQLENELQKEIDNKNKIKLLYEQLKQQYDQAINLNAKPKIAELITESIEYKRGKEFEGIFYYLTKKTKGNIGDNGTIDVTTDSGYGQYNLLDPNDDSYYFSANSYKAWVCFDFKNMRVQLTGYSLKSCKWSANCGHIKSWVIEVSNDNEHWTEVNRRENCSDLNGEFIVKNYLVKPNEFSRYVRFRHIDIEVWGGYPYALGAIEFFGKITI